METQNLSAGEFLNMHFEDWFCQAFRDLAFAISIHKNENRFDLFIIYGKTSKSSFDKTKKNIFC